MESNDGAGRKAKQKHASENFKSSQQHRDVQMNSRHDVVSIAATTSTTANSLDERSFSSPSLAKTAAAPTRNQSVQNDQARQTALPWSTTTYSMPLYSSYGSGDVMPSAAGYLVDGRSENNAIPIDGTARGGRENSSVDLGLLAFYDALNLGHESKKTTQSGGSNLTNRFNNQSDTSDSNLFLNDDRSRSSRAGADQLRANKRLELAQTTNHYQVNHDDIFGRSYSCLPDSSQQHLSAQHYQAVESNRLSMFNLQPHLPQQQTISNTAIVSAHNRIQPSDLTALSSALLASSQQQQGASQNQSGRKFEELFSNTVSTYQLSGSPLTGVGQQYPSLFDCSTLTSQEQSIGGAANGQSSSIVGSTNSNYISGISNSRGQPTFPSSNSNFASKRRGKLPFFPGAGGGGVSGGFVGDNRHRMKVDLNAGPGSSDANGSERFSRKVFVGGLPPDIDEEEIKASFRRFGSLIVDWPHKTESKSYFPPKGYAFLLFHEETSVQALIDSCIREEDKLYLCVSSPTIKDKPVQIRPWRLSDADFVSDSALALEPRKTVFVGGVPRPLKASELANMINNLYGGVCYAGIDTDPELKYPKGAGRVAFSNHQSYIAAISARYVHLHHSEIEKRVEVKPYVLDDQFCDECQGSSCDNKFAPFFCANITCLRYYCDGCWASVHSQPGREFHKPLVKESADRPRGPASSARWSGGGQ